MIIKEKIGTLKDIFIGPRQLDYLLIEWYETGKRILHKTTLYGQDVVLKLLNTTSPLMEDDVVYQDDTTLIVIKIPACNVIVLKPENRYAMAQLCYEIGNKHLPLFYEDETLLIPHDTPLYLWLEASGFKPALEVRKLLQPLRTNVSAHAHKDAGSSLFSKILKFTSPSND